MALLVGARARRASGIGAVLFVLGSFGPLLAAAVTLRLTGGSLRAWLRGLVRWRVSPRWYLFALGVPIALAVITTAEFAALGRELDWDLLDERLAAFLPSLVVVALIGGGNEEPGWRGFALPRLQERTTPVRATLILGLAWALWHLPLLFASEDAAHGLPTLGVLLLVLVTVLSIVGYAFAYTYLLNRTGSVLLCVGLHAGFNVANASAGLRTEAGLQRWDYILLLVLTAVTVWVGVAVLVAATRGRLGAPRGSAAPQAPAAPRPPAPRTD